MKRFLSVLISVILCMTFFSGCETTKIDGLNIVATNFPAYDFAKNIVKDKGTVTLLLPPGGESHTYEPTAKDIVKISECDIFVYTGGESDDWVERTLSTLDKKPKTIKMMDFVDICRKEHEDHENHEGHTHGTDEHIWTSLPMAADIVDSMSSAIILTDSKNTDYYRSNAQEYISEINELDKEFEELFKTSKRKTIVVADRFPFTYFAQRYNLKYYSAYHSCNEDAEPTPTVIGELIDAVKAENIPIIFYIEFSNKTVATAVSEDTGAKIAQLHSCHSVTKQELNDGITYIDLMRKNYEILKEAVNL